VSDPLRLPGSNAARAHDGAGDGTPPLAGPPADGDLSEADLLRRRMIEALSINHDINNALVGVFGNAQLLALGPAGQMPGVKERLEVIQREAKRIKDAALRLAEIKHGLIVEGNGGRAATGDPGTKGAKE
jgi:signal transduction histidine kinase